VFSVGKPDATINLLWDAYATPTTNAGIIDFGSVWCCRFRFGSVLLISVWSGIIDFGSVWHL